MRFGLLVGGELDEEASGDQRGDVGVVLVDEGELPGGEPLVVDRGLDSGELVAGHAGASYGPQRIGVTYMKRFENVPVPAVTP